jgi:L-histidine N-alpha-methyltransferase
LSSLARAKVQEAAAEAVAADVRQALGGSPPSLPSKYFYDAAGMALFERITELPEYYLTRTEHAILARDAGMVIEEVRPREVVEIGSGTSPKLRMLLDAMAQRRLLERCTLLDINAAALRTSAAALAGRYPGLKTRTVVADFQQGFDALGAAPARLICFLGSTIGNLDPREVRPFLRRLRGHLAHDGALLLGLDLVKDTARLEAAYNDAQGVTAEFNLNLLRALNRRLGAGFDVAAFEHVAFYDRERAWIEMRVRATRATRAALPPCALDLTLARGDEIRTEISCKFTRASLEARLRGTRLHLERWLTDPEELFALALLRPDRD